MGIMDIMGLMSGSHEDGQPGMMDQIKNAGESFNRLAQDMSEVRAQNAEIRAQNQEILRRLAEWEEHENARDTGSKS